jgi:phosphatidylglycerol lysyltransferase
MVMTGPSETADGPATRRLLRGMVLEIAPPISATLAFVAGIALLVSAAQPALPDRLDALLGLWPMAAVELSHFLASIVGALLLIVAGGLWRRMDGAWWLTMALLLAGAIFSLVKALDWEEAALLSLIALGLGRVHGAFYRRSRMVASLLSAPWLVAALAVLAASLWLLLASHQTSDYRDDLWFDLLRQSDASRSLRALAGALIVSLLALAWLALHPGNPDQHGLESTETAAQVRTVLATGEASQGEANLALTGDKAFVFSPTGKSFVMYRRRRDLWIAMSDPVGPLAERLDALVAFHTAADSHGASPVIYGASSSLLPALIDMGYAIGKIGEKAMIDVPGFNLDGSRRAKLRQAQNRANREGWQVEVVMPATGELLAQLRPVSTAWLEAHKGREKSFSLGRFEPDYLANFPIALMRGGPDDRAVAFASLWPTPDRGQLGIDLMRHDQAGPGNVMDVLFLGIIAWAKQQGYRRFDMGMTPLAGLPGHRFAPAMSLLGGAIFAGGEQFYGFQGLRAFKSKFDPAWEPVFIAAPGHVSLPFALADAALLTSGGLRGLLLD